MKLYQKTLIVLSLLFLLLSCSSIEMVKKEDILFKETPIKSVTFDVNEVEVAKDSLREEVFPRMMSYIRYPGKVNLYDATVESYNQKHQRVVPTGSFIRTVDHSFRDHRPLILSPDMIWLLICQGFSNHINYSPEKFREDLVYHEGKMKLKARYNDFTKGDINNNWEIIFPQFAKEIKKHTKGELYETIVSEFSTTTIVEKSAFEIALMESVKEYFSYEVIPICGIPKITLEGTTEDWIKVLNNTKKLRKYDLDWWVDDLTPILEQFIETSKGDVNLTFWKSIYKQYEEKEEKGCSYLKVPYVNGWIIKFYPYINQIKMPERGNNKLTRNPFIGSSFSFLEFDLELGSFPNNVCSVDFEWFYYSEKFDMKLFSGFIGAIQDKETVSLKPNISWILYDKHGKRDNR